MLRRNDPVMKSVDSLLRLEESLWWGKICGRSRFWAGTERM